MAAGRLSLAELRLAAAVPETPLGASAALTLRALPPSHFERPPAAKSRQRRAAFKITVRVAGRVREFVGRDGWALDRLIDAGQGGLTTAMLPPGVRFSQYVLKLRRAGIDVETRHESHGGIFSGRHGVYVLKTHCERVTPPNAERAAA